MVHGVLAGSATVATVNVTLASLCPVFPIAAVYMCVPQPCLAEAVAEARVHVGSTTTIVPLLVGTLEHRNVSTKVLGAPAVGLLTISNVFKNAATVAAVNVVLAVAEGVVAAAIVAPMVRVARFVV